MSTESIEKTELSDVLPLVLAEISKNKELIREIDEILIEKHSIPRSTLNEVSINLEKFFQMNEKEAVAFVSVLFDVTKDERINLNNFYNEKEIKRGLRYNGGKEEDIYPLVLQKVTSSPDNSEFTFPMTFQQIAKISNNKVWSYNFNAQRLSKKTLLKSGKISEKIDIKMKSVDEIIKLMEDGKYKSDTLYFNALVDGLDNIEYDEDEMTLTINEGTTLNLIDGMHRIKAIIRVVEKNPDAQGFMWVCIKHYSLAESQFMLGQVNKKNAFDKTLIKHYMGEDYSSQITKELMNIPELKNKISIKTTIDKKLNYFTNYAILSEAIEAIFSPQNGKDRYDYAEVLKKFFAYLVPSFSNELIKNHKEVAKTSWLTHHNTFVGFVVIAHALYKKYGKEYPVDEIVRIIKAIDLSKTIGSEYNDLLTTQGKVNSNQVKAKIRKFFEEKTSELLN